MPADVRNAAASRRTFRKLSTEEEIEIRRARGEISCAECRRLKLKCDKKLPCGSCVRRGCSSVCPNGSLTTGQGTRCVWILLDCVRGVFILFIRFVLADTEQLHRKIAEMGQRIRQLEDALAIFQSGVTNETHPLLREELLGVKFGPEVQTPADSEPVRDTVAESMDALGTLTIGDDGESKYFGRSAGSEVRARAPF
jgi:Fungal Zn(2)-Cys(6) binuclear cluster domain